MKKFSIICIVLIIAIMCCGVAKIASFDQQTEPESSSLPSEEPVVSETQSVPAEAAGKIIEKNMAVQAVDSRYTNVKINNQTGLEINAESYFYKKLDFKITKKSTEPQILIMHTHTTESYMSENREYYTSDDEDRTTDETKNVVAVGEKMKEQLEKAGYTVIHDKTKHDYPGYTGSYTRSADTVKAILAEHPSIKIVIDLHRDSISSGEVDKVAPVTEINGKKAAQVMFVMGSNTGTITDYPDWEKNLSLAVKIQNVFNIMYPGLARPLLLRPAKYNQNLTSGSILIEVGSEANTLDEALYSGELIGKAVAVYLGIEQ